MVEADELGDDEEYQGVYLSLSVEISKAFLALLSLSFLIYCCLSYFLLRPPALLLDILDDVKEECSKYAPVVSLKIPRAEPGLGKVCKERVLAY